MGFGLLVLGYIFTFVMSLTLYAYIPRIIGYIIMLVALEKLKPYEKTFKYTQISTIPLFCVAIYQGVTDILIKTGVISTGTIPQNIIEITLVSFIMLFHILLLLSIFYIAKDTGLTKIKNGAVRNIVVMSVYAGLFLFIQLNTSLSDQYKRYFTLNALIIQLLWTVLNIFLILSCAKNICPLDEEQTVQKESKFTFVNKFRRELNRKEQKAKAEMLEYRKQKQAERLNKIQENKNRYNNKKKRNR